MRKAGYSLMIVVACAALAAGTADAQTKVGSTLGTFLRIEPGARGAGLGNAGSALPGGIEAVYYNTGALGLIEGGAVLYSHADWFAGISHDYVGAAIPVKGFGNVFTSVTALNSGDIDVRTVETNRARVFDKLGVANAVELANFVREHGLDDDDKTGD